LYWERRAFFLSFRDFGLAATAKLSQFFPLPEKKAPSFSLGFPE